MTTQEVLRRIESVEFSCLLGIASSVRMVTRILNDTEEVKYLVKLNNPDIIKTRIEVLLWCDRFYETKYMSHFDTALATYLYVLDKLNVILPDLTLDSRWFWARKMYESCQSF